MHINDIITAIENHSVLIVATAEENERRETLNKRIYEVRGMLELARRLSGYHKLVRFLKSHIEWLEIKLAGL
jgi:hypothetical protein